MRDTRFVTKKISNVYFIYTYDQKVSVIVAARHPIYYTRVYVRVVVTGR